jgi:hypothetical protein
MLRRTPSALVVEPGDAATGSSVGLIDEAREIGATLLDERHDLLEVEIADTPVGGMRHQLDGVRLKPAVVGDARESSGAVLGAGIGGAAWTD